MVMHGLLAEVGNVVVLIDVVGGIASHRLARRGVRNEEERGAYTLHPRMQSTSEGRPGKAAGGALDSSRQTSTVQ